MIRDGLTVAGAEGIYGLTFSLDDDYYLALYTGAANLDETTPAYTAMHEAKGQGYLPGGKRLSRPKLVREGMWFIWDFDDLLWPNSSIEACCGLIYNRTKNRSLAVMSFEPTLSKNGNFRIIMPPPTAAEGVVRFEF